MKLLIFTCLLICCTYVLTQEEETTSLSSESEDPEEEEEEGQAERVEKLKISGFALAKTLAAVLGVVNPVVGTGLAAGIEIFEPIIEAISGEQDVWSQVEKQVDIRIGQKLSTSKISSYKDMLFNFNERMKKGKQFEKADLYYIIGKMEAVIPFDTSLGWDDELPLMMVHYLPYLIASYQEVMKKDKELPACQLANHMNIFRSRVILGCKEMMKKRYKLIHDETWKEYEESCDVKRMQKYFVGGYNQSQISRRGLLGATGKCNAYEMIYRDSATGRTIKGRRRHRTLKRYQKTWEFMINKYIRNPTVDFLYKNVIEKINKYFIDDICLKTQYDCKCPEPIRKNEISFGWPKNCYGKDTCLFPAGNFGCSYTWCYTRNTYNWAYADRYDLDMCMPVNRPYVKPLNVIERKIKDNQE